MAKAVPLPVAIAELQADLALIVEQTKDAMAEELAEVADTSVAKIGGSSEDPYATGKTRGSVRMLQEGETQFALQSNEPQAAVWNWGGTIEPRGAPIVIPRTEFVTGPVMAAGTDIDERVADRFDTITHRHGFV